MQSPHPKTKLASIPYFVWTSIGIVVLTGLIAGVARAATTQPQPSTAKTSQQLIQAAKFKLDAAKQDTAPSQKFSDAVHGLAQLDAARLMLPDSQLQAHGNIADLYAMLQTERAAAMDAMRTTII
jgi:hypothetical protein